MKGARWIKRSLVDRLSLLIPSGWLSGGVKPVGPSFPSGPLSRNLADCSFNYLIGGLFSWIGIRSALLTPPL